MLYTKTAVAPGTLAVLIKLQSIDALQPFALGGGTNLALRLGHRVSIDLDLFTTSEFDLQQVKLQLKKHFPSLVIMSESWQTLNVTIEGIKVDLLYFPYPYLGAVESVDGIRLLALPDVIAMKLGAIQKRSTKKDFYDIVQLLGQSTFEQMFSFFQTKFPNTDIGHLIHMLYKASEADSDLDPQLLIDCSRSTTKAVLKQRLDEYVDKRV